jgi:hypothetical protein
MNIVFQQGRSGSMHAEQELQQLSIQGTAFLHTKRTIMDIIRGRAVPKVSTGEKPSE